MSKKPTYEELEKRIQELEKTESKLRSSESELRDSQQVIEGILNAIPARVFWKDQNLVYLGCNKLFSQDAGFAEPKDLIGKDDYQMGWHDQAELYRKDDREVIESGDSKLLIEEPQTTPEGNTITLLTSKTPLRSAKGEITGMLGTYMDITDRKRADAALRKSEVKYRILFESSKDANYIISFEGHIIEANKSFWNLFGYTGEDLPDLVFQDMFVNPNDSTKLIKEVEKHGFVKDFELKLINKSNMELNCQITATVHLSSDGLISGYACKQR